MLRKLIRVAALGFLGLSTSFGNVAAQSTTPEPAPSGAAQAVSAALKVLLDGALAVDSSLPGIAVRIDTPLLSSPVEAAAGYADRETGEPLSASDSFRIASITKTFTAAATLRLVENGEIALNQPLSTLLSKDYLDALTAGGYDPALIDVYQLLTHTSGLYDYATDEAYQAEAFSNPAKHWTRLEQVQWAMDHGAPLGAPGAQYGYSDTGYILLGEIIEQSTGKNLGESYRTLLNFDQIGLTHTYLPSIEPVPAGEPPLMHQYLDGEDVTNVDPSADLYGGGGLISTLADLNAFYWALFNGGVFEHPETLDTMLTIPTVNEAEGAAAGIFQLSATPALWSHSGFWGSSVFYLPDFDVTISFTYNQVNPIGFDPGEFVSTIINGLASILGLGGESSPSPVA